MTEADWLQARNPDAMLTLVGRRLSPRQWRLLASASARRAWGEAPAGPLADALDAAEQLDPPADPLAWQAAVTAAAPAAVAAARHEIGLIVRPAAPDTDPTGYRNPAGRLFAAAGRSAREAVDAAGAAAGHAADAIRELFGRRADAARLERVRELAVAATLARKAADMHAFQARKLADEADEAADPAVGGSSRHRAAAAADLAFREQVYAGYRHSALPAKFEQADKRAVGRLLHEIAGNPFRPVRLDPRWRTSTVVGLAAGIDADRGYDRLPILADALLEADCDDEAILRHCRGTEPHAGEPGGHVRGCWVIELVLGREAAYFTAPPALSRRTPAPVRLPRRPAESAEPRRTRPQERVV